MAGPWVRHWQVKQKLPGPVAQARPGCAPPRLGGAPPRQPPPSRPRPLQAATGALSRKLAPSPAPRTRTRPGPTALRVIPDPGVRPRHGDAGPREPPPLTATLPGPAARLPQPWTPRSRSPTPTVGTAQATSLGAVPRTSWTFPSSSIMTI